MPSTVLCSHKSHAAKRQLSLVSATVAPAAAAITPINATDKRPFDVVIGAAYRTTRAVNDAPIPTSLSPPSPIRTPPLYQEMASDCPRDTLAPQHSTPL